MLSNYRHSAVIPNLKRAYLSYDAQHVISNNNNSNLLVNLYKPHRVTAIWMCYRRWPHTIGLWTCLMILVIIHFYGLSQQRINLIMEDFLSRNYRRTRLFMNHNYQAISHSRLHTMIHIRPRVRVNCLLFCWKVELKWRNLKNACGNKNKEKNETHEKVVSRFLQ